MQKIENEYKYKENYKSKLIKIINESKKILRRKEKSLLEEAENADLEAAKQLTDRKKEKQ